MHYKENVALSTKRADTSATRVEAGEADVLPQYTNQEHLCLESSVRLCYVYAVQPELVRQIAAFLYVGLVCEGRVLHATDAVIFC